MQALIRVLREKDTQSGSDHDLTLRHNLLSPRCMRLVTGILIQARGRDHIPGRPYASQERYATASYPLAPLMGGLPAPHTPGPAHGGAARPPIPPGNSISLRAASVMLPDRDG